MFRQRHIRSRIEEALNDEPAVALIGPRQVGKTTLARMIGDDRDAIYLDLEARAGREKLHDPVAYLSRYADRLVIVDEIHRLPNLFEDLRGIIDDGRRKGIEAGRFLLLGSASIDLMRQSETLAGRIAYVDMHPFIVSELVDEETPETLWLRGGFPRSFLAADDSQSINRRENFIRTYLERDIPMFGPRVPAETLRRLWTMLAHNQGGLLNASQLARNLGVSAPTISTYVDLLCDLLLVRRLAPYHANVGKRLIKSPKTYVRDSGVLHALLEIETIDDLLGHPVVGMSWEGFVIESILSALPGRVESAFYRTSAGAEIDLILTVGRPRKTWAVEVKRSPAAKLTKGFLSALDDVQPDRAFVVSSGNERYPKTRDIEMIGLPEFIRLIRSSV